MPDAVRRRLGKAAGVAASSERIDALVTRLLDQPGADATNRRQAACAAVYLVAPLFVVDPRAALVFGALVLAAWGWVGRAVADRVALRALVLGFAARRPAGADHPYCCRRCNAPLPVAEDGIVIACVYCSADNVLGLDVLAHAREPGATGAETLLETQLRLRDADRRAATTKIVIGGVLGAIAIVAFAAMQR